MFREDASRNAPLLAVLKWSLENGKGSSLYVTLANIASFHGKEQLYKTREFESTTIEDLKVSVVCYCQLVLNFVTTGLFMNELMSRITSG